MIYNELLSKKVYRLIALDRNSYFLILHGAGD